MLAGYPLTLSKVYGLTLKFQESVRDVPEVKVSEAVCLLGPANGAAGWKTAVMVEPGLVTVAVTGAPSNVSLTLARSTGVPPSVITTLIGEFGDASCVLTAGTTLVTMVGLPPAAAR